jgi:hypothetical protein
MRYEIEPNQYVLRVYDEHPQNYVATALVRVYGDRAWVSSISSPRLFDALQEHFVSFLDKIGVVSLEGYMSKAMARALRIKSKSWALYEETDHGMCAGRVMAWVRLRPKVG